MYYNNKVKMDFSHYMLYQDSSNIISTCCLHSVSIYTVLNKPNSLIICNALTFFV